MLFTFSCRKSEKFPDTPSIEWVSHERIPASGVPEEIVCNLYFTDGDGDIGSANKGAFDTCNTDAYDLYIRYFEKSGGEFVEIFPKDTASCLYFHQKLPDITPEGQNKILEGNLFVPFVYLGYPEKANVDSIKFEIILKDRAGRKSNVLTSPPIFIPPR